MKCLVLMGEKRNAKKSAYMTNVDFGCRSDQVRDFLLAGRELYYWVATRASLIFALKFCQLEDGAGVIIRVYSEFSRQKFTFLDSFKL